MLSRILRYSAWEYFILDGWGSGASSSPAFLCPSCSRLFLLSASKASAQTPSFVLWGDSHASSIIPAVDAVAKREHRSGLFAATDSCPPLIGVTRPDAWKCKAFNDAVLAFNNSRAVFPTVLVAGMFGFTEAQFFEVEAAAREAPHVSFTK